MLLKNLQVPSGRIDVVLDTDAYNEIDDQFAISYMLRSKEKLNVKAIYAAPFLNQHSESPKDGMEKSYNEIFKILELAKENTQVFKGSESYLADETTPVISDAANDLIKRAMEYTPEAPLYVVAIGAITNIASALLLKPEIAERIVVVWLGGHALHYHDTYEFNMFQDIASARVVVNSGAAFVQLPCNGVVDSFRISGSDLEHWFKGKNELADYLAVNTVNEVSSYVGNRAWSRVIWDVTAVAWLLNDNNRFMQSRIVPRHLPTYDHQYQLDDNATPMVYVYHIDRDGLLNDLIEKIAGNNN